MRHLPSNTLRRKPSQRRALEVTDAIRTAAAQVLMHHGYARATTNRIAEAAGVSIGTLYQYYASKDAVFDELAEHFLGAMTDAVRRAAEHTSDLPLEPRVHALVRAGAAVLATRPGLLRALDAAPETSFRARLVTARSVVRALVQRLLVGETGHVDDTIRHRARLLAAMAEGAALDVEATDDIGVFADEITHVVLEYVARR